MCFSSYTQMYANGTDMCQNMWGESFKVSESSCLCLQMNKKDMVAIKHLLSESSEESSSMSSSEEHACQKRLLKFEALQQEEGKGTRWILVDERQKEKNHCGGWGQGITAACLIPRFREHNKSMVGYINPSLSLFWFFFASASQSSQASQHRCNLVTSIRSLKVTSRVGFQREEHRQCLLI